MKFPYPEVTADTTPTGRFYHTPFGPTPSVTTILSTQPSPELDAWKERVGIEEAERIRDEAATIGGHMHDYLECMVEGKEIGKPADSHQSLGLKMARLMKLRVLTSANLNEVWGTECALWFQDLYAGRTDLVGVWQGVPSIIDYKTSLRPKKMDRVEGYAMQTCAYALAHNDQYGTDIRQTVILIAVRPDWQGDINLQRFVIEGDQFRKYAQDWLELVEGYVSARTS